jgi:protocatechuate 3,4-dioxygenase beta subunit
MICAQTISLTPSQTEGPYYGPGSPLKPDFRPDVESVTPTSWPELTISGRVFNQYGVPIPNAKLDFWHANSTGVYDNSSVPPVRPPVTYALRGHLFADENGEYLFKSIMPGLYEGRTRHLHFKVFDAVNTNTELLTSQLYWPAPYDNDVNADGTLDRPRGTSLAQDGVFRNTTALIVDILNDPKTDGEFITSYDFVVRTNAPAPNGADLNGDRGYDITDLNSLYGAIRGQWNAPSYDLSQNGTIGQEDIDTWLSQAATAKGLTEPYAYGDANLDGTFDSSDLIEIFQAGEYEDTVADNSTWSEGDWNGDFEFDTGDLTLAFQQGRYDSGAAAVAGVPEPSSVIMGLILGFGFVRFKRRSSIELKATKASASRTASSPRRWD